MTNIKRNELTATVLFNEYSQPAKYKEGYITIKPVTISSIINVVGSKGEKYDTQKVVNFLVENSGKEYKKIGGTSYMVKL